MFGTRSATAAAERDSQPRLQCDACSQEITGEWKVVKDLAAWDGKKECLVGTKITRSANSITWHEAQWNCAWYVWENGLWKTPSGALKTAEPDVFDVRKIFVENAEYGFVEDDDPDWQIWKTLPAPGHRNGPK